MFAIRTWSLAAAWLSALLAPRLLAQESPRANETRTVLAIEIHVTASGSQPASRSGVWGAAQRFAYERTVSGTIALTTATETTGAGADARELLRFAARSSGASQLTAVAIDSAWQTFTESGEGGVPEVYHAMETWHSCVRPQGRDLRPVLVLDAAQKQWQLVDFDIDRILRMLTDHVQYTGVATMTPAMGRGWSHAAGRKEDRVVDGKFVDGGLQPGGFLPPMAVQLHRNAVAARIEKNLYAGRMELDLGPVLPPDVGRLRATVVWSVREEVADCDLVVAPSAYTFWRPKALPASAEAERQPGSTLLLVAALVRADPAAPGRLPKIEELTWRLVETSREPGIAMNFPFKSQDRRPDLELSGESAGQSPADPERQGVRHQRPLFNRSRVALHSYDWGGSAKLEVEARLADGRTVRGHLLGHREITSIPLPKPLLSGQRIAMLEPHAGKRDDADDERDPPGRDGTQGDGLSNYEEYRGFYVDGRHVAGDPVKKDLFVRVESGGRPARDALATFAGISGLAVHDTLRSDELPGGRAGRVINVNHGTGPHPVDQHALIVRTTGGVQRPVAYGKAPLRSVPCVALPLALFGHAPSLGGLAPTSDGSGDGALLRQLTVQALFVAVGVDRPGRGDFTTRLVLVPPEPGGLPMIVAGSQRTPVTVLDEQGRDVAITRWQAAQATTQRIRDMGLIEIFPTLAQSAASWYWRIGVPGGEHSGPDTCVMRDWFADARAMHRGGAPVLIENGAPREQPGRTLGTQLTGTGVNAPGKSRYGDIRGGRPPANAQLVVNDRYP